MGSLAYIILKWGVETGEHHGLGSLAENYKLQIQGEIFSKNKKQKNPEVIEKDIPG